MELVSCIHSPMHGGNEAAKVVAAIQIGWTDRSKPDSHKLWALCAECADRLEAVIGSFSTVLVEAGVAEVFARTRHLSHVLVANGTPFDNITATALVQLAALIMRNGVMPNAGTLTRERWLATCASCFDHAPKLT